MAPKARSLVLDLLSTLHKGSMPVSALVAAGDLFGIAENNIRVTLARLYARGSIERDARGRYRLHGGARAIQDQLRSWRGLRARPRGWDGSWLAVYAPFPSARRSAQRRGQRALRFLGFRSLRPDLFVRPSNLPGGVRRARERLADLGLDPAALIFRLRDLDAESERRARELWDVEQLRNGYARCLRSIERSEVRLASLSRQRAMVETFQVGGRVLRELVFDPLLPEPIVRPEWRETLVNAMRRYDRLGRECWADFLGRYGVPHRSGPVDLRLEAIADGLPSLEDVGNAA